MFISSGGHYCVNGTVSPAVCEFPYYCPPTSHQPKICSLGYIASTDGGLRVWETDYCKKCPGGFYGNDPLRKNCTICPKGYFCPAGTKGPYDNPCEPGHYCPEKSSSQIPCPVGYFSDIPNAVSLTDCRPCPKDTFNSETGQISCPICGSSSTSIKGQSTCTCTGKNRGFLASNKACLCDFGYIYYGPDKVQGEGDSVLDCQQIVRSIFLIIVCFLTLQYFFFFCSPFVSSSSTRSLLFSSLLSSLFASSSTRSLLYSSLLFSPLLSFCLLFFYYFSYFSTLLFHVTPSLQCTTEKNNIFACLVIWRPEWHCTYTLFKNGRHSEKIISTKRINSFVY